jgi:hypothetical protein
MWFSHAKLILLGALFLSACQPQMVTLTPPPTPQIWQVETTPALRWLGPIFQRCAAGVAGANLVLSEHPAAQLGGAQIDFSFQWGEHAAPVGFAVVVGHDPLAVVVNPANPVDKLAPSEVRALFSGKTDSWSQAIKTRCASCGPDFEGAIRAYVYAAGEDVQTAAGWLSAGPNSVLAPGPAEVRATIAQERYSVGYLPGRWLDTSVKALVVEPAEPGLLDQPILAFAPREPQGAQRAWLACVQASLK